MVARLVYEQDPLRIGALNSEQAYVVGGKGVGRINPHLTATETIRNVQGWKFHRGTSPCRHLDAACSDQLAVDNEGHGAGCDRSMVAGDHSVDDRLILFPNLARGINAFHRPVGHRIPGHGV